MKKTLDYQLQRSLIDGETDLTLDGYIVAVFYDDGTFRRIRYVGQNIGVQLDEEGRIIEEAPADLPLPTIKLR